MQLARNLERNWTEPLKSEHWSLHGTTARIMPCLAGFEKKNDGGQSSAREKSPGQGVLGCFSPSPPSSVGYTALMVRPLGRAIPLDPGDLQPVFFSRIWRGSFENFRILHSTEAAMFIASSNKLSGRGAHIFQAFFVNFESRFSDFRATRSSSST